MKEGVGKACLLLVLEQQRTGSGLVLSPATLKSCCRSCKGTINVPCNNVIALMDTGEALNAFSFFFFYNVALYLAASQL